MRDDFTFHVFTFYDLIPDAPRECGFRLVGDTDLRKSGTKIPGNLRRV